MSDYDKISYNSIKERLNNTILDLQMCRCDIEDKYDDSKEAIQKAIDEVKRANSYLKPTYNYLILQPYLSSAQIDVIDNLFCKKYKCESDRYSLNGEESTWSTNVKKFIGNLPKIDYVIMIKGYNPDSEYTDNILKAIRDILYYQDDARVVFFDLEDKTFENYDDLYPEGLYREMKKNGYLK